MLRTKMSAVVWMACLFLVGCLFGKDGDDGEAPTIERFVVEPNAIKPGEEARLHWEVTAVGELEIEIQPELGVIEDDVAPTVSPMETTTYTLEATNEHGTATANATLMVTERDKSVMFGPLSDVRVVQNKREPAEAQVRFSVHTMPPEWVSMVEVTAESADDSVVESAELDPSCDADGKCSMSFAVAREEAASVEVTLDALAPESTSNQGSFDVNVVPMRVVRGDDSDSSGTLRTVVEVAQPGNVIRIELKDESPAVEIAEPIRVDKELAIHGTGRDESTIRGAGTRIFEVGPEAQLELSELTLENGAARGDENNGGCIWNAGTLRLNAVNVQDCSAEEEGGGLYNEGEIALSGTAFLRNGARFGGAVYNGGILGIEDGLFAGNGSGLSGAGIYNTGELTVRSSTFEDNVAGVRGGAIFSNPTEETPVYVTNSTLSSNEANDGAGLYNRGSMYVAFATIADNIADREGGGVYGQAPLMLRGNIIGNNEAPTGPDVGGTVETLGYNIITDPADAIIEGEAPGDLLEVELELGPLQDNGGATPTLLPAADGPAIDQVPPEDCLDAMEMELTADQRGETRPAPDGGDCDIGSVELQ